MLKCKKANLDVTRSFSWSAVIDDLYRRVVVFIYWSRVLLPIAKFLKYKSQVLRDFSGRVGSDEFSFGRALRTYGLCA